MIFQLHCLLELFCQVCNVLSLLWLLFLLELLELFTLRFTLHELGSEFVFLVFVRVISPLSESFTLCILNPVVNSASQLPFPVIMFFKSIKPRIKALCHAWMYEPRYEVSHYLVTLWLHLRYQVFLSILINLNLSVNFSDLWVVVTLSTL